MLSVRPVELHSPHQAGSGSSASVLPTGKSLLLHNLGEHGSSVLIAQHFVSNASYSSGGGEGEPHKVKLTRCNRARPLARGRLTADASTDRRSPPESTNRKHHVVPAYPWPSDMDPCHLRLRDHRIGQSLLWESSKRVIQDGAHQSPIALMVRCHPGICLHPMHIHIPNFV